MKMQGKIALLITITALLYTFGLEAKGDHEPWCNWPKSFPPSMKTVDMQVDIDKYMGTWYEVVRKGGDAFQGKCVCSQAVYTFLKDKGKVQVDNSCIDKDGKTEEAIGFAYSENKQNTQLEVYFNPKFGGNYWMLALDESYSHVLVGEPCAKMLWVLSRTKTLPKATIDSLLNVAYSQGYNDKHLVYRSPSC